MDTLNVVMVDLYRSKLRIFRKMTKFVTKIAGNFGPKCVKFKKFSKIFKGVKNTTIATTYAIGHNELRPSFFVSLKCYFEEAKTFG